MTALLVAILSLMRNMRHTRYSDIPIRCICVHRIVHDYFARVHPDALVNHCGLSVPFTKAYMFRHTRDPSMLPFTIALP